MDKQSLLNSIHVNNDIENPLQIGYEKEFLITAVSTNGEIYNLLDIGEDIIKCTKKTMAKHHLSFTKEYSRSLMELVTPPFYSDEALTGLDSLNTAYNSIGNCLGILTSNYESLKEYNLALSDEGSSSSHAYITRRGELFSGNRNQPDLVLEKYKEFVEKNQYISWEISEKNKKEMFISTYNHINSFHLTFHPTYKKDTNNFERYLKTLDHALMLIDQYKPHDIGNKQIRREHKVTTLKYNLRDIFLAQLFKLVYGDNPESVTKPSSAQEFSEETFIDFSLSLLKENIDYQSVDELYAKWPALNLRPRIINNMFCIEIRAFGSNFSHTAHNLIQNIILLDKTIS